MDAPVGPVGVSAGFTQLSGSAKLLELDEALLSAVLGGGALHLKGSGDEPLVLTTRSATYAVLNVETSNSLFVCRAGAAGAPLALEVRAKLGGAMQLVRAAPSTRRLQQLLLRFGPYTGAPDDAALDEGGDDAADAASPTRRSAAAAAGSAADGSGGGDGGSGVDSAAATAAAPSTRSLSMPMTMGTSQYGEQYGLEQYGRTQVLGGAVDDSDDDDDDEDESDAARLAGSDGAGGDGGGGARSSGRKRAAAAADGDEGGSQGAPRQRRKRVRHRSGPSVDDVAAARGGYTFAQLCALCPMSDDELTRGLVALGALRVELAEPPQRAQPAGSSSSSSSGSVFVYRLLQDAFADSVRDAVLAEVGAQGAPLSAVGVQAVARGLEYRIPPFVSAHVLRGMSTGGHPPEPEAPGAASSGELVCLDFGRVALAKGVAILRAAAAAAAASSRPASAELPVPSFMAQWRRALPAAMVTGCSANGEEEEGEEARSAPHLPASATAGYLRLSLLAGHVLLDAPAAAGGGKSLRYFSHVDLEDDPPARFAQLFEARPRWSEADITPFILPLAGASRKVADLLLAHARSTLNPDGSRVFSKR